MLKSVQKILLQFLFLGGGGFHGDRAARFYHQIFIISYVYYIPLALPILLYGSETWTVKASDARRITAAA